MTRRGHTLTECIVACGLLTTLVSVTTTLTHRITRLHHHLECDRLALDELHNQMERLQMLDDDELTAAVGAVEVSAVVHSSLPDSNMQFDLSTSNDLQRLKLTLSWNQLGRRDRPLSLVAWRPGPADTAGDPRTSTDVDDSDNGDRAPESDATTEGDDS